MSGSNWFTLIVVIATGICLYALYHSWETKNARLAKEKKEMQTDLSEALADHKEALQQLKALKKLREEDSRHAVVLSRQMRDFQEQNKEVLGDFTVNMKTPEEGEKILQTVCEEDWKNIQNILDRYKRQIEEKDGQIASLTENLQKEKERNEKLRNPLDAQAGTVPWDQVEEIVSVYQAAWNQLCVDRAKENNPTTPVTKRLRLSAYDHCLAKVLALQRRMKGKTTDRNAYRRILKAYRATCRRKKDYSPPWKKPETRKTRRTRNPRTGSLHPGLPYCENGKNK